MHKHLKLAVCSLAVVASQAFASKPPDTPSPPLPTDVLLNTPAPGHANYHSPVSNVPEADTVALALAGAGVVGGVLWRRRKNGKRD